MNDLYFGFVIIGIMGLVYLVRDYFNKIPRKQQYFFNGAVENLLNEVFKNNFVKKFEVDYTRRTRTGIELPFKPISYIYSDYISMEKNYTLTLKNNIIAHLHLQNFYAHNAKEVQSLLNSPYLDKLNRINLEADTKLFSKDSYTFNTKYIEEKSSRYSEFLYVRISLRGISLGTSVEMGSLFCIPDTSMLNAVVEVELERDPDNPDNKDLKRKGVCSEKKTLNPIKVYVENILKNPNSPT